MAGHGSKIGRKQEDAIAALLTQRNVEGSRATHHIVRALVGLRFIESNAGHAMAGLLAISAGFEREATRERTRACLVHARQNGKPLDANYGWTQSC
jgi:DNA invertase Pin-like site-specific DNA recombinase